MVRRARRFSHLQVAVTTIVAAQEGWPATLRAIGTMAAAQQVTVSADLPGTVERITFESGRAAREGEVLAELDTRWGAQLRRSFLCDWLEPRRLIVAGSSLGLDVIACPKSA